MPYDDPDPTDPMTFHAVALETDGPDCAADMARCFVQEFAALGMTAGQIMDLFTCGRYSGPALALSALGRDGVAAVIDEEMAIRGPRRQRVCVDRRPDGAFELPVLNG